MAKVHIYLFPVVKTELVEHKAVCGHVVWGYTSRYLSVITEIPVLVQY